MNKTITRKNQGYDKKMILIEVPFLIAKLEEDKNNLRRQAEEYLAKEDEKSHHLYFRLMEAVWYFERIIYQLKEEEQKVVESGGRFIDYLPLL